VAEGGGLLNRYTVNIRIVGSNPIPSATFRNLWFDFKYLRIFALNDIPADLSVPSGQLRMVADTNRLDCVPKPGGRLRRARYLGDLAVVQRRHICSPGSAWDLARTRCGVRPAVFCDGLLSERMQAPPGCRRHAAPPRHPHHRRLSALSRRQHRFESGRGRQDFHGLQLARTEKMRKRRTCKRP
jgi:hypothetical protein